MAANPPTWTHDDLTRDIKVGILQFRESRLGEPQKKWIDEYELMRAEFMRMVDEYGVSDPESMTPRDVAKIFEDGLGESFRYLLGPPVSADDLRKIADVQSLAPSKLRAEEGDQQSLLDLLKFGLDPKRFPWVGKNRKPTKAEIANAVNVSASLRAAQRVQTHRRMSSKDQQEESVKNFLRQMGFTEASARPIGNISKAPPPGTFSAESMVGSRKADVPVRLFDGRLMPIECKVSNSELNSIKRINNDAAVKAHTWISEFGRVNVVPVAMLTGVFGVASLEAAQQNGLTLFWAHNLEPMRTFINDTR